MLLTEYNEAEAMELFKEEGRKEGREDGRREKELENIQSLMETLKLTAKQAMDVLKVPLAEQAFYAAKL